MVCRQMMAFRIFTSKINGADETYDEALEDTKVRCADIDQSKVLGD